MKFSIYSTYNIIFSSFWTQICPLSTQKTIRHYCTRCIVLSKKKICSKVRYFDYYCTGTNENPFYRNLQECSTSRPDRVGTKTAFQHASPLLDEALDVFSTKIIIVIIISITIEITCATCKNDITVKLYSSSKGSWKHKQQCI